MAKVRKQFLLDPGKIEVVKKITHATTDTEAINRALDMVIATCYEPTARNLPSRKKSAGKMKSHRALRSAIRATGKPLSAVVRKARGEEKF